MRGLNMRADGHSTDADFACLTTAKLDAAKICTNTDFDELHRLGSIVPAGNVVLRLFADFTSRIIKPSDFFEWHVAWLTEFQASGGRYVEVHNEPNLTLEGYGSSWT